MTLRLRLVLALVALVAVGLAVFGVATYAAYSRRSTSASTISSAPRQPFVHRPAVRRRPSRPTVMTAGVAGDGNGYGEPGPGGPPAGRPVVPSGTYAELRDPDGAVAGHDPALGLDQRSCPARRPDGVR